MSLGKFYLTTAIPYISHVPHLGNVYDPVFADAIARYKRLRGYDVYLLTGTDEHGLKIQKQAEALGITPQAHADHIVGEVKRIWDLMGVSYDQFIRTTDPAHQRRVQKIFKQLYEQGDIYKGSYEGLYCLPCETFYTETQVSDGGGVCPTCGAKLDKASEEAYFFRLSKYADRLMAHIEANPDFVVPESRKNEMISNFLKPGLQDLCVSRTSFSWGIPVDFDPGHVVYVWIDALTNYITALGFEADGPSGPLHGTYWPADLHIIGKDILRFHVIYWPIILMALGQPLPRQVFGHPWLLFGAEKMSKSTGNTAYADALAAEFGVDAVRYYLLREMSYTSDSSFTREQFIQRLNADLANDLGNLLSRTVAMIDKYFGGLLPEARRGEPLDAQVLALADQVVGAYNDYMDRLQASAALTELWKLVGRANKYIDETLPWALGRDPAQTPRLAAVLGTLRDVLRRLAPCLAPIMPDAAEKLLAQIGPEGGPVSRGPALFPRVGDKKTEDRGQKTEGTPEAADAKAVAPSVAADGLIGIDEFAKVELRAALVLSCEAVPKSDKLLRLTVDAGEAEPRQVVSGIARWYAPEGLVGRTVLLVKNLKPVKLRGVDSRGMILCAENDPEDVRVIFAPDGVKPGAVVR
ncbi:MAG: methionine--tRNA ligase [Oscillospiraceae bacterium]|jgi:methionyl-tRNA synthetase|nr:methionine--tRNA ligase [Oscillospiraceae bacterium]